MVDNWKITQTFLRTKVKLAKNLRIADKCETGSRLDDLVDWKVKLIGEVAHDGEDHGASQQGGERVREADDERVLVGIMTELVVRTEILIFAKCLGNICEILIERPQCVFVK